MAKAAASARSNTAAAHDRPRSKVGMAVSPTPKCRRGLLARSVAGKDHAAQFRKPSLNLCIGEGRVDFRVELIDHLSGRVLGRTKPINRTRFVAWHKFGHGRDVQQCRISQVADNCVALTRFGGVLPKGLDFHKPKNHISLVVDSSIRKPGKSSKTAKRPVAR